MIRVRRSNQPLNRSQTRQLMRDLVRSKLNGTDLGIPLVLKCFTGSGKTKNVIREIDDLGLTWIYVAPFHEVIKDELLLTTPLEGDGHPHVYNFLHLEGRQRLCCHAPMKDLLNRYDFNITPYCEAKVGKEFICTYRKMGLCDYYNRLSHLDEGRNIATVHSYFKLKRFADLLKNEDKYDVLVIDEIPMQSIVDQATFGKQELKITRGILKTLRMDSGARSVMDGVMDCLFNTCDTPTGDPVVNYSALLGAATRRNDFEFAYNDYIRALTEVIINTPEFIQRYKIPKFPQLLLGILQNAPTEGVEEYLSHRVYSARYFEKFPRIFVNDYTPIDFSRVPTIIGMDGTASEESWKFALGRTEIQYYEITYDLSNVVEMENGRITQSTWVPSLKKYKFNTTNGTRWLQLLVKIVEHTPGKVLVCGTKKTLAAVREGLGDKLFNRPDIQEKITSLKYYYLRSLNKYYVECDTIVLLHTPSPPWTNVTAYAFITGKSEEFWKRVFSQEEMLQALGRIRQTEDTARGRVRKDVSLVIFPDRTSGVFTTEERARMLLQGRLREFKYNEYVEYLDGNVIFILDALPGNIKEVAGRCGMSERRARLKLLDLAGVGLVEKHGRVWSLSNI